MTPETQEVSASQTPISNIPQPFELDGVSLMTEKRSVHYMNAGDLTLDDDYNPRRYPVPAARITELAVDIVANGQLYPVLARKINGKIVPFDGFSRTRAILYANENKMYKDNPRWNGDPIKVAVSVVDIEHDADAFIKGVAANMKRTDMSPVDYANMIRVLTGEFGMSKKDIAVQFKKAPSWVTEHSQIGELPPAIQKKIHDGKIPYTSVRELVACETEEEQLELVASLEKGESRESVKSRSKAKKRKKAHGAAGASEAKVPYTLKELRQEYEELAGLNLEEGKECKFSEKMQAVGVLLIKHMDGKMTAQVLANRLTDLGIKGK